MTTTRTVIVASATGILGLLIGFGVTFWFLLRLLSYGSTTSALASVATGGVVLEKVETGDIEGAKKLLYTYLDGQILTIDAAVQEGYALTPGNGEAISRVKQLREIAGYRSSDPTIQAAVDGALLRVERATPNSSLERTREK